MVTARTADGPTEEDAADQQPDCPHPRDRPPLGERITVALVPKAVEDLKQLQDRTSLSKTDVANRAISLYKFIDEQIREGRDVLIRDKSTGETRIILIV